MKDVGLTALFFVFYRLNFAFSMSLGCFSYSELLELEEDELDEELDDEFDDDFFMFLLLSRIAEATALDGYLLIALAVLGLTSRFCKECIVTFFQINI